MGIDIHGLNFLRHVRRQGVLGKTITIGRQGLHASPRQLGAALDGGAGYADDVYAERLMRERFGATAVDSLDNSDFEQATLVHDMNRPLPAGLHRGYDTVLDGGSLEHIFNVPQALANCSLLCRPGGQILHILPANNACGHGFWQFSPELFFSLYSEANGYAGTEVFLVDTSDASTWYRVHAPSNGMRVNIVSTSEVYALVRTVPAGETFSHAHVQQSDYAFHWESGEGSGGRSAPPPAPPQRLRRLLAGFPALRAQASRLYRGYVDRRNLARFLAQSQLDARNPGLTVVRLDGFL